MSGLSVVPARATITPKFGGSALTFSGQAEGAGSKGDFSVSGPVPGQPEGLAVWVYLAPDANVGSVGFQFYDAQGEGLLFQTPATWTGWKQVEVNFATSPVVPAWTQPDKNGKVDFPLKDVHIIWFAKTAGTSALTVDELSATTRLADALPSPLQMQLGGGNSGEPRQALSSQLVLTNYTGQEAAPKIEYSIQRASEFYSKTPPDPVYGSDEALGAPSWTDVDGVKVESGSLTDGKDWTNVRPRFGNGGGTEAFQTVDLGRVRRITRLAYVSGDANWAWKVDVQASADGKDFQPVPGVQGVDVHQKWGAQTFPDAAPFSARFVRLRYHKDGEKVGDFAMFGSLSVYDGIADESLDLPKVGEVVASGTLSPKIAANDFGAVPIQSDKPLATGNYLLAVRVQSGDKTQIVTRNYSVLPAPTARIPADSRFGLNSAASLHNPSLALLGIGWVRFENAKWPMFSTQPGEFKYDGSIAPWKVNLDGLVSDYRRQGLHVLPFLFQTADYATSAPASVPQGRWVAYPPKDNAQMANFVFQTVARYGSKKHPASELETPDKKSGLNQMDTYEIWNEPNLHDPGWSGWVGTNAQYMEMFRVAALAAKRADPSVRITNGGLAGIDMGAVDPLRSYKYADGKKPLDFMDILNVHYYSGQTAPEIATVDSNADRSGGKAGARTFEDDLRALVAWRDTNKPAMPIWMTETGYDSGGQVGVGETLQAARLPRVVMMMLAEGIDKVFVYRESGSTPSLFASSGLYRDDETLTPSWFTYATLIRQLDGAKPLGRLPYADPNVRLYAWSRGKETVLTAWTVEGKGALKLKLGQSQVTDAFGGVRQVNIAGDLALSDFPQYISGASDLAPVTALLTQRRQKEVALQQQKAQQSKKKAYLFDFGGVDKVGSLELGTTRAFTPVLAANVFDETTGYGFFPTPAMSDNSRGWISDPLETDAVRVGKGGTFRFKVAPGRYHLQMGAAAVGGSVSFSVKGADGGDQTLSFGGDSPAQGMDVQVSGDTLSVESSDYADLRWLSLIER